MLQTDRLVQLRKARNLSKREVSFILNLEQSTYGKYELGHRQPSLEVLSDISGLFNVSTDYLLGKSDVVTIQGDVKREPTYKERLAQEFMDMVENVPDEKLDKVILLLHTAIDAVK